MTHDPFEDALRELLHCKFNIRSSAADMIRYKGDLTYSSGFVAHNDSDPKEAYLVSVSYEDHLSNDGIEYLLEKLEYFPGFLDLFRDHNIYGMIVVTDISDEMRDEVLKRGLYLIRRRGDKVRLQVPRGFQPIDYGLAARRSRGDKEIFSREAAKHRVVRAVVEDVVKSPLSNPDQSLNEDYPEVQMAKQNIWKILEHIAQSQAETDRIVKETAQSQAETDRIVKETALEIKQVNKQLGEMGNKWGTFAAGMAYPSLVKMLEQNFRMNIIGPSKSSLNGRSLEIDVLAYDNGSLKEAYVVEIKSRLTKDAIKQILNTLSEAPEFFPELQGRRLFGILAAVEIPDNTRKAATDAGIYIAQISDDIFKLSVPKKFEPKDFGKTTHRNGASNGRKKKSPSN